MNKNIELNQEFHFANPKTKFKINQIYNSHFTGSPLWNLFSAESLRFESSYNRSVKIMFNLPYATHCHLIEPITEAKHLRTILVSRFLGFIEQIRKSDKIMPKLMLSHISQDVRSTTGLNLRKILLQTNKVSVDQLGKSDIHSISYFPTPDDEIWKERMAIELLEARDNQLEVEGFEQEELETFLEYLCVS